MKTTSQTGFTLIELMITVAIIGILAAVAMPSYTEHVKNSHRADAKVILLQNAQFLERNYTEANRYDQDSGGTAITLPNTVSPISGTSLYDITAVLGTTTYALTATPVTGRSMDGDACGSLSINQFGQKTVTNATLTASTCWSK